MASETFVNKSDIAVDVTGEIPMKPLRSVQSMFQLPFQVSVSSAAKEWFGSRRENVRPWNVFVNTRNFRTASNFPRLSKRVVKNVDYFLSNYILIFIGLIMYCLITSPLLLIAVAVSLGACYALSIRPTQRKIGMLELSPSQQYALVGVCSFPLFYIAGAGSAIFWVLAGWIQLFEGRLETLENNPRSARKREIAEVQLLDHPPYCPDLTPCNSGRLLEEILLCWKTFKSSAEPCPGYKFSSVDNVSV